MPTPTPRPRPVARLKESILNTSLTPYYECHFNPPSSILGLIPGANSDEDYTLSCMEASLPGTSLATVELTNDHSGITERHVHRRQYDTTSSFTFLVDRNYKQIKFFETWIGYIVNEQNSEDPNYFYRVNFPQGATGYQTKISIVKFEKDYKNAYLQYDFLKAYPISIDSMPVSYDGVNTLKCTVNFNFSRYITRSAAVKKAPYPVLGDADSSRWVGGRQFGLVAPTNEGAVQADFFANSPEGLRAQEALKALQDN